MSDVPLADLRQDYGRESLRREHLAPNPIAQFERWFQAAAACPEITEPNAMTLATSDLQGEVSARIVLLKGINAEGFRFFTNYESYKGRQLTDNPQAALLFFWPTLERQIKIRGAIEKLSREEANVYFQSRPRGNQLGASVSSQSTVVANREELDDRLAALEKEYEGKPIPLPPFWGGYILRPTVLEFWQGRKNRLHDCFRYRQEKSRWIIERLAP
ncbi:MAG: pyridoxamine 5'-phosphate oxidase [Chthoniobacterales bacterium]